MAPNEPEPSQLEHCERGRASSGIGIGERHEPNRPLPAGPEVVGGPQVVADHPALELEDSLLATRGQERTYGINSKDPAQRVTMVHAHREHAETPIVFLGKSLHASGVEIKVC